MYKVVKNNLRKLGILLFLAISILSYFTYNYFQSDLLYRSIIKKDYYNEKVSIDVSIYSNQEDTDPYLKLSSTEDNFVSDSYEHKRVNTNYEITPNPDFTNTNIELNLILKDDIVYLKDKDESNEKNDDVWKEYDLYEDELDIKRDITGPVLDIKDLFEKKVFHECLSKKLNLDPKKAEMQVKNSSCYLSIFPIFYYPDDLQILESNIDLNTNNGYKLSSVDIYALVLEKQSEEVYKVSISYEINYGTVENLKEITLENGQNVKLD